MTLKQYIHYGYLTERQDKLKRLVDAEAIKEVKDICHPPPKYTRPEIKFTPLSLTKFIRSLRP